MQDLGFVVGLRSEAARLIRAGAPADRIGVAAGDPLRAETLAGDLAKRGVAALLSFGVCGGLDPLLRAGDLIVTECVAGEAAAAAPDWADALRAGLHAQGRVAKHGAVAGADAPVTTPRAKDALYEASRACAVDMESVGVIRAAVAAGTPFLAIRAVGDDAHAALPKAVQNAMAPDGRTKIGAVIGGLARRPQDLPAVMRLGEGMNAALAALEAAAMLTANQAVTSS